MSAPSENQTPREQLEQRIVALLMGELAPVEVAEVEQLIADDVELKAFYREMERTIALVRDATQSTVVEANVGEEHLKLSKERREALLAKFRESRSEKKEAIPFPVQQRRPYWMIPMAIAASLMLALWLQFPPSRKLGEKAYRGFMFNIAMHDRLGDAGSAPSATIEAERDLDSGLTEGESRLPSVRFAITRKDQPVAAVSRSLAESTEPLSQRDARKEVDYFSDNISARSTKRPTESPQPATDSVNLWAEVPLHVPGTDLNGRAKRDVAPTATTGGTYAFFDQSGIGPRPSTAPAATPGDKSDGYRGRDFSTFARPSRHESKPEFAGAELFGTKPAENDALVSSLTRAGGNRAKSAGDVLSYGVGGGGAGSAPQSGSGRGSIASLEKLPATGTLFRSFAGISGNDAAPPTGPASSRGSVAAGFDKAQLASIVPDISAPAIDAELQSAQRFSGTAGTTAPNQTHWAFDSGARSRELAAAATPMIPPVDEFQRLPALINGGAGMKGESNRYYRQNYSVDKDFAGEDREKGAQSPAGTRTIVISDGVSEPSAKLPAPQVPKFEAGGYLAQPTTWGANKSEISQPMPQQGQSGGQQPSTYSEFSTLTDSRAKPSQPNTQWFGKSEGQSRMDPTANDAKGLGRRFGIQKMDQEVDALGFSAGQNRQGNESGRAIVLTDELDVGEPTRRGQTSSGVNRGLAKKRADVELLVKLAEVDNTVVVPQFRMMEAKEEALGEQLRKSIGNPIAKPETNLRLLNELSEQTASNPSAGIRTANSESAKQSAPPVTLNMPATAATPKFLDGQETARANDQRWRISRDKMFGDQRAGESAPRATEQARAVQSADEMLRSAETPAFANALGATPAREFGWADKRPVPAGEPAPADNYFLSPNLPTAKQKRSEDYILDAITPLGEERSRVRRSDRVEHGVNLFEDFDDDGAVSINASSPAKDKSRAVHSVGVVGLAEGLELKRKSVPGKVEELQRQPATPALPVRLSVLSGRAAPQKAAAAKASQDLRLKGKLAQLGNTAPEEEMELPKQSAKPASGSQRAKKMAPPIANPAPKSGEKKVQKPAAKPAPKPEPTSVLTPKPEVQTSVESFSTFSLNVSDVAFKLAAASLDQGRLPDAATVRTEEFINAMKYHDPAPGPGERLSFNWEQARNPFAHNRDLLRFSVQTAAQGREAGRPLNLVLLLDNSGSMERTDRVQIVRQALGVLAQQLTTNDKISVVTFARTPRLWVDGMKGGNPNALLQRISNLVPQGGTNLEDALDTAYAIARKHATDQGVNRVILLTDGAANLGNVNPADLKRKVEQQRRRNIALDCFGIGWEGYNDDLLEQLSRNGDGRYGFINHPGQARTEFAEQLAGALRVAASNVKTQVQFNPDRVISYRQIGYDLHQLKKEQFRDNKVDAAEIGAAESGTAMYSVQLNRRGKGPIGVVRVRYMVPETGVYHEEQWELPYNPVTPNLEESMPAMRLATVATSFAEWLARSPYAGTVTLAALQQYLRGVPETFPNDERPRVLAQMIQQARTISGE